MSPFGRAHGDPEALEGSKGHSYGSEGAAYVGATSKMFAAVGMGAGVVDLANDSAMNRGWSYGVQAGSGDWRTRTGGTTSAEWRTRKT